MEDEGYDRILKVFIGSVISIIVMVIIELITDNEMIIKLFSIPMFAACLLIGYTIMELYDRREQKHEEGS